MVLDDNLILCVTESLEKARESEVKTTRWPFTTNLIFKKKTISKQDLACFLVINTVYTLL